MPAALKHDIKTDMLLTEALLYEIEILGVELALESQDVNEMEPVNLLQHCITSQSETITNIQREYKQKLAELHTINQRVNQSLHSTIVETHRLYQSEQEELQTQQHELNSLQQKQKMQKIAREENERALVHMTRLKEERTRR